MNAIESVIKKWVDKFNEGNATSISGLYHVDGIKEFATGKILKGQQQILDIYEQEFQATKMECIVDRLIAADNTVTLEWKDPLGLRGCSIFTLENGLIVYERVYFDELSFLRAHKLALPRK
jgi:hypothetical protein